MSKPSNCSKPNPKVMLSPGQSLTLLTLTDGTVKFSYFRDTGISTIKKGDGLKIRAWKRVTTISCHLRYTHVRERLHALKLFITCPSGFLFAFSILNCTQAPASRLYQAHNMLLLLTVLCTACCAMI